MISISMKFCISVAFICAVLMHVANATAEQSQSEIFNEDNLALLDVVYQRQFIGNGIDAYIADDKVYLPLVDLVSMYEVDVEVGESYALGTLYNTQQPFELKKQDGRWLYLVEGLSPVALPDHAVALHNGLLYITGALSDQIFGVEFNVNFSDSRAILKLRSPLPFSERLARQKRSIDPQSTIGPPVLPELKQPYEWVAMPSLDVRLNYLNTRYESEDVKDPYTNSLYYSTKTVGDFLGMSTETFFSGVRDKGLSGASIRMERFDNSHELLGPLRLSQISLGDISHPTIAGATGSYGRGIIVGNDIVSGTASRDIRDIEGDYFPEWEVELYLNGAIVGYQKLGEDGHYKFEDVILFDGDNKFLLKFYGPSGEVVEQRRSIFVGSKSQDINRFRYSLSLSQPGERVIDISDRAISQTTGTNDEWQMVFSSRYRPAKNFGLSFGYQEIKHDLTNDTEESAADNPSEDVELEEQLDKSQYYSVGMQTYLGGTNISMESTTEIDGPTNLNLTFGGNAYNTQYQLRYFQYDSDKTEEEQSLSDARVNKAYEASLNSRWGSHSTVARARRSLFQEGNLDEARLGYSGQFGLFGFSTALEYENNTLISILDPEMTETELLNGTSFVGFSARPVFLRFSGAYSIKPETELTNISLSTSWRIDSATNLDASINHNLLAESTQYRIGLTWVNHNFRIAPMIVYSDTGYWQGQVQFSLSLGGRTGRLGNYYRLGADPTLTQGTVRARLFDDLNRDGSYQIGETLLSGGELKALQSRRQSRSNNAGIAWLESMPSWRKTDLYINENSIDSGYVKLAREPFSVTPRPGAVLDIDIPFVKVGEADGSVYFVDTDLMLEARGVNVQLLDQYGAVVATHRTDSLGYFTFARIAPGTYSVSVEDETVESVVPEKIYIGSSGNYVSDVKVHIKARKAKTELDKALDALSVPATGLEAPDTSSSPASEQTGEQDPMLDGNDAVFNGIEMPNITQQVISSAPILPMVDVPVLWESEPAQIEAPSDDVDKQLEKTNPIPKGYWGLQLASFSVKNSADELLRNIRQQGYDGVIQLVEVKGREYHRVLVTGFSSKQEALVEKPQVDLAFGVKSITLKI